MEKFNKYQAGVKALPGEWSQFDKNVGGTVESFAEMTQALLAQREILRDQKKMFEEQDKAEREAAKAQKERDQQEIRRLQAKKNEVKAMAAAAKSMALGTASAVGSLAKIVGIGGIVSGLLGAGGLFGIDRLAENVSASRRQALGLGVSTGQLQSAQLTLGQNFDVGGLLQSLANAKGDPSQGYLWHSLGINPNGRDAADLLGPTLQAVQAFYKPIKNSQNALAMAHARFGNNIDDNTLRALGEMSSDELRQHIKQYDQGKKTLKVQDEVNMKWQSFAQTMSMAGLQVQNTLVNKLVSLTGPLSGLAKSLGDVLVALISSKPFANFLKIATSGLEAFAKYLGTPKFQQDLDRCIAKFGEITDAIVTFANSDFVKTIASQLKARQVDVTNLNVHDPLGPNGILTNTTGALKHPWGPGGPNYGALQPLVDAAAKAWGVSANFLKNILHTESGGNPNAVNPKSGAMGAFQFMGPTARQYGVNPFDPNSSAQGAAHYIADLMRMFHNDMAKVAAAYNWGQGNLQKDIKAHGADWLRYAPKETQDYVRKTTGITVTIHNPAGAQVAVQASQLPQ